MTSPHEIVALVPGGLEAVRLGGGTYNAVYRVSVAGGDDVVVKVSPPAGAPALTYERDLLRTEAMFDELAAERTSAPVPRLVDADFSRTRVGGDVVVLSALPGRSRSGSWDRRCHQRRALGRAVADLHTVRGDRFGYPYGGPGLQGDTWRAAFLAMVDAVLADAERFEVKLPVPPGAVRDIVDRSAHWLDDVAEPVLVHFDLWDGNLLVDEHGALTGIVDAERAFWGDAHAEFASLALFGTIEADREFLVGHAEGGGHVEPGPSFTPSFSPSFTRRQALYRTYLYLLMAVEAAPRGYGAGWQRTVGAHVDQHLAAELRRLGP
jgi:aminoglycoside phosphotransferase (APT) family kinase protein